MSFLSILYLSTVSYSISPYLSGLQSLGTSITLLFLFRSSAFLFPANQKILLNKLFLLILSQTQNYYSSNSSVETPFSMSSFQILLIYSYCFLAFYCFFFSLRSTQRIFYLSTLISWLSLSMAVSSSSLPVLSLSFLECSTVFLDRTASSDLSLSIIVFFSLRIFSILDMRSVMSPPACLAYKAAMSCSYVLICLYTFSNYFLRTSPPELKGMSFGGYFFVLSFSVCSAKASLILIISILRRRLRYSSSDMYLPLNYSITYLMSSPMLSFYLIRDRCVSGVSRNSLSASNERRSRELRIIVINQIIDFSKSPPLIWKAVTELQKAIVIHSFSLHQEIYSSDWTINYNRMHNKPISTPQKSLRSYLDMLQGSPHRRNSIFSKARTPSTSKTVRVKESIRTEPRLRTEPIQHRTTEDLVSQMAELLNTIKAKYDVYVKAEEENLLLQKENTFLKQQLTKLRREVAQNEEEADPTHFKTKNQLFKERFGQARKQLKQLKKLYAYDNDIAEGFEQVLKILTVESQYN